MSGSTGPRPAAPDHQPALGFGAGAPARLPRKYQVFISSTFTDLIEERRAVTEAVLKLKHIPVGMELFQAGNEDQWSYIKRRILEVDYYLVIVAERYGSLGKEGLSYTEMEYRFAAEHGVPTAAFLLHRDARKAWPRDRVEFERQRQIDDFRALCERKMVTFWSNAGELVGQSILALTDLIETFPRTGWIAADSAGDPAQARELSRLSEENGALRARLAELEAARGAAAPLEVERVAGKIRKSLSGFLGDVVAQNGIVPADAPAELAGFLTEALATVSIADFLLEHVWLIAYQETDRQFDAVCERWLRERLARLDAEAMTRATGAAPGMIERFVGGIANATKLLLFTLDVTEFVRVSDKQVSLRFTPFGKAVLAKLSAPLVWTGG